jgi:hypothetical protein
MPALTVFPQEDREDGETISQLSGASAVQLKKTTRAY